MTISSPNPGAPGLAEILEGVTGHDGWRGADTPYLCFDRLRNPYHRCSHDIPGVFGPPPPVGIAGAWHDHVAWLFRGDGRRPTQWALVSQPYPGFDPDQLIDAVASVGCEVVALPVGSGPYSNMTEVLVLLGKQARERPRPERVGSGRVNSIEQGEALTGKDTPVFGSVVRLGDPELVAAELLEKSGPEGARRVAAWLLLLADEVAS